jgi:hypothetical protein
VVVSCAYACLYAFLAHTISTLSLQVNTGVRDITAIAKIASLKELVLIGNGGKVVPGFASKLTNLECVHKQG